MEPSTRSGNLTDREMLLLLADQMRRLETTMDRLTATLESRLAQGDRRFAEFETRQADSERRHTATNNAINGLSGRLIDHERALHEESAARKVVEAKLEAQADEFATWKTRAQTIGAVLGVAWAFVTFVWPFLPTLILIVNGGTP